jgi:glucosyl-dolichyl phosphate glucuronosyltransferase
VQPNTVAELLVVASPLMTEATAIVREAAVLGPISVRLVPENKPGLSNARNQGLRESAYDHVAYFDDDVEVSPDWIDGYFEAVERHGADCVVGPVSPIFEEALPDYFTEPILQGIASSYSRRGSQMMVLPREIAHELPGCNFGVRRQAALDVGGFNPRLGRSGRTMIGGDDFEFGRQLAIAGKTIVYQPRCSVGHVISSEKLTKSWSRRRWYGLGVWQRFVYEEQGSRHTAQLKLAGVYRIFKRATASALYRVARHPGPAFENELQLVREAGFLLGTKNR